MDTSLHRLVYYSRNHVAPTSLDTELDGILAASRKNNVQVGITGALLFNEGCFAQILEGDIDDVETTFERIQQDPRHGEVSLLALDKIDERSFPQWAMGFVGASEEAMDKFSAISRESGFDPARLDGDAVNALLVDLIMAEEKV